MGFALLESYVAQIVADNKDGVQSRFFEDFIPRVGDTKVVVISEFCSKFLVLDLFWLRFLGQMMLTNETAVIVDHGIGEVDSLKKWGK